MTGQTVRKGALMKSGTPSPDPWDLSLSRQNDCFKLEVLERRIGLRRDATRAPIQVPEWQGAGWQSRPQYSTPRPRRTLAYCGQKMVLTMGSTLDLADGRTIIVPLTWYPRLLSATMEQRSRWKVSGAGYGIHWPEIDEDLSTEGLLRGATAAAEPARLSH
jgi:hypothetical protein